MSECKLYRCFWLQADMTLISPMHIGSGESKKTDDDLLIGADGKMYIPGSSLAGVIRDSLQESNSGLTKGELNCLFGDDIASKRQSMVYFYDAEIKEDSPHVTVIRDGIEINEATKTAKNGSKYDLEVLNPGAVFRLRMEIIIREQFKELPVLQFVSDFLDCAEKGDFYIGSKISRGYGRVELSNICYKDLVMEAPEDEKRLESEQNAMKEYVAFDWSTLQKKEVKLPPSKYQSPYTVLEMPLKLESTLLIRSYYLTNFDVDCEQLAVNGKAVIPGGAWAGLFRHKVKEFLTELADSSTAGTMTAALFGPEKISNDRQKSRIFFDETKDESGAKESRFREMTRNKIDRFTGGVLKTGLFSERIAVGGNYTLRVKIKDTKDFEIGIILLAMEELGNGLMAIGGTTGIGRGTMKQQDAPTLNGNAISEEMKKNYWKALEKELGRRNGGKL